MAQTNSETGELNHGYLEKSNWVENEIYFTGSGAINYLPPAISSEHTIITSTGTKKDYMG